MYAKTLDDALVNVLNQVAPYKAEVQAAHHAEISHRLRATAIAERACEAVRDYSTKNEVKLRIAIEKALAPLREMIKRELSTELAGLDIDANELVNISRLHHHSAYQAIRAELVDKATKLPHRSKVSPPYDTILPQKYKDDTNFRRSIDAISRFVSYEFTCHDARFYNAEMANHLISDLTETVIADGDAQDLKNRIAQNAAFTIARS